MKKQKAAGLIGVIFGTLFLSMELCMLKFIQLLEKSTGSWYEDVWRYMGEPPFNIALIITVGVIVLSAIVYFTAKES